MSSRSHPGWIVLSRELAGDLLELADAEIGATREEIGRIWRRAGIVIACLIGIVCLAFWLIALLAYVLVALLAPKLGWWGAGLVVAGLLVLGIVIFGAIAWWHARRFENPIDIALRRLRDHLAWWKSELAAEQGGPVGLDGVPEETFEAAPPAAARRES